MGINEMNGEADYKTDGIGLRNNIRAQGRQKGPGQTKGAGPFNRYKGTANALTIRMDDPFKVMDSSITEQIERFVEAWG